MGAWLCNGRPIASVHNPQGQEGSNLKQFTSAEGPWSCTDQIIRMTSPLNVIMTRATLSVTGTRFQQQPVVFSKVRGSSHPRAILPRWTLALDESDEHSLNQPPQVPFVSMQRLPRHQNNNLIQLLSYKLGMYISRALAELVSSYSSYSATIIFPKSHITMILHLSYAHRLVVMLVALPGRSYGQFVSYTLCWPGYCKGIATN